MHHRVLPFLAALLLLFLPAGAVWAAPAAQTVVGEEDVIRNDIVLFDDDFELAAGGQVNGDIILFNGSAKLAGAVNGDVVLFNGNLTIEATAELSGECVLFNGTASGDGIESVRCTSLDSLLPDRLANFVSEFTASGSLPAAPSEVQQPSAFAQFIGGAVAALGRSLLLGLLAFAAASLLPGPMTRIEEALRAKPLASGVVGLLTSFSMPFVVAILAVISAVLILACGLGLLGFPVIFVMILALVAAGFLGWFTVGNVVGEFLGQRLNWKNRTPALTTALGTAVITFAIGFLGAVPFVFGESVISLVILFLGLGATALTKFGTRPYPIIAGPVMNQEKITAVLETLPDKAGTDE